MSIDPAVVYGKLHLFVEIAQRTIAVMLPIVENVMSEGVLAFYSMSMEKFLSLYSQERDVAPSLFH